MRFIKGIGNSIVIYIKDIIFEYIAFKKGVFNGLFILSILISVFVADIILVIDNRDGDDLEIIFAGIIVLFILLIIGYIIFLFFDFLPKRFIINKILPIRSKLDEILENSQLLKYSFTEAHEIEKFHKIVKFERIPDDEILEMWLYILKVQRIIYVIFAPVFYLFVATTILILDNKNIKVFDSIFTLVNDYTKSYDNLLQAIKWAFILFVVTNESMAINIDISRIELLKGLLPKIKVKNAMKLCK